MVLFVDRNETVALDSLMTFRAGRSEMQLKAVLTVQDALLLHKSAVLQWSSAVITGEVLRTKGLS